MSASTANRVVTSISLDRDRRARHEAAAARENLSRSEFYARAGDLYESMLGRDSLADRVRETNLVLEQVGQPEADWIDALALTRLSAVEW